MSDSVVGLSRPEYSLPEPVDKPVDNSGTFRKPACEPSATSLSVVCHSRASHHCVTPVTAMVHSRATVTALGEQYELVP
jgi:hypothetical protein